MADEFDDYEEIGGRCDMSYRCDLCEESEYSHDDDGELSSMTKMFRVGTDDVCEHCLRRLIEKPVGELVDELGKSSEGKR